MKKLCLNEIIFLKNWTFSLNLACLATLHLMAYHLTQYFVLRYNAPILRIFPHHSAIETVSPMAKNFGDAQKKSFLDNFGRPAGRSLAG